MQKTIQLVIALMAQRSYSKSILRLRINSVAINKDLEKLPGVSTVLLDEDESCHSNGMTPAITYFTFSSISRHWELFFQNGSRELFPLTAASMFVRFK